MKRPAFVLSFMLTLVGALSASCIKRQPLPEEPAGNASQSGTPATPVAVPPAQRPPTGLWGKVQGEDVLGGKGTRALMISGQAERVEARLLPVSGQPFDEMIQVKITEPSKNTWDVQLRAGNETRIEKGDVLLATIHFRTEWVADESGEGLTEVVFELARDPWTKSVTYPTRAGAQWKELHIPFIADGNFDPGEGQFAFRMGYSNQTVQLGGIKLENFKQELALADLPKTKLTYPGQEADAEWRGPAQDRIDQIRKEELAVLVRDASGKPLENAKVSVRMKKHAFYFGTAVPADLIVNNDNPKFKETTKSYFNMATLENDLKWQPLAGDWGKSYTMERALSATDWLLKQDIAVRGHVLVWPGWENLPSYLKQHEKNPERLKKEVRSHIVEMVTALKGKVVDWDVVNEPFTNHDLLDILGPEIMVEWFELARKTDPTAKLYINDFAILSGGGGTTGHRDHYEKMIKLLVDKKAPLDGIGFQGHFGTALTGPVDVYKLLERYGKYNKRFAVTEYDLLVEDENLAADFTRDFYTIMFSHPLTDSLIMWGFWDARHWKKNAPMYRADWSEKPAGKEYRRLIEKEWATNVDGATTAEGTYNVRAFLGDYEITVTSGSRKKVIKAKVQKGRTDPLVVTL
jgi:endo-1,4-beta-xylanase